MRLVWTDEVRKRVQPRRFEDLRAPSKPKKAAMYFRSVARRYRASDLVDEGMKATSPELAPHVKAADAMLAAAEPGPEEPPLDVLALLWRMAPSATAGSAQSRWLDEAFGLETAVASWARAAFIDVHRRSYRAPDHKGMSFVLRDTPSRPPEETWFREALLRAPRRVYENARDAVRPVFEGGDMLTRMTVVERFPNEPAWADALAQEYLDASTPPRHWRLVAVLHGSVSDPDLACALVERAGPGAGDLESVLAHFGEDAVPWIFGLTERAKQAHELERIARVLSVVDDAHVAAFYAKHLGKKTVRRWAVDWFPRHPHHADALLPLTDGRGRVAKMAADVLGQCSRLRETGDQGPEASLEELPRVLVDPPWVAGPPKRRVITITKPPSLSAPARIHGTVEARRRLPEAEMTPDQVREWRGKVEDARAAGGNRRFTVRLHEDYQSKTRVPLEDVVREWNEGWPWYLQPYDVAQVLFMARERALPGLVRWAERVAPSAYAAWTLHPLRDVEHAPLAPPLALQLGRAPGLRAFAKQWMRRFPEAAIAGLLPAAVGRRSRRRTSAEAALRWLATAGWDEHVRRRARELGRRGAAAVDEILAWDPLYDCPKKPPTVGRRFRPAAFPRPRLVSGARLPPSAVQRLAEMLAFVPRDDTYVGLEQVREVCDARSLAELAWALACAWENGGADGRDAWMYYSLVHLADDEVVRRTTPALKNSAIVDVLTHIGTPAAAMELATIAYRGRKRSSTYHGARTAADQALDRIAESRGMSRDELDDQLTPTAGLDANGNMELDLGSRRFRVGFDQHLTPVVVDEKGNQRAQLPRGSKRDDPALIARAHAAWDELREDVSTVAAFRIDALERAMLSDRSWPIDEWETHWAKHPLLLHLARRMVWAARRDGECAFTFRLVEDGTCSDAADEPRTLEGVTSVAVPHPRSWPDRTLDAWRVVFDDYQLIQPVLQLHRPPPRITEDELAATVLVRRRASGSKDALLRGLNERGFSTAQYGRTMLRVDDVELQVTVRPAEAGSGLLVTLQATDRSPLSAVPRDVLFRVLDELGVPEPD